MTATIVGAGMFSLPYVFLKSGWVTGILYLAVLGGVIIFAHDLYLRLLQRTKTKQRLLGFIARYLGETWRHVGFWIIEVGLLLALVIYLILGRDFLVLLFPPLTPWAVFIFWAAASLPLLAGLRRLVFSEIFGAACMTGLILLIFTSAFPWSVNRTIPSFSYEHLLLPFGVVLFSIAGWTAIEPIYDSRKANRGAMAGGVIAAALLYILFVFGILGSADMITPDTLSGLSAWPSWKFNILLALGLFALWTSYVPISLEIKNSLLHDVRWPASLVHVAVIFLPLLLYGFGFRSFLEVLGLAGGVFLSLQYVCIVLVGKKALELHPLERFFANVVAAAFILAAVYGIYSFVVK